MNKVIVLILTLFVILRIPSLFEGFWYTDEGFYAVGAQTILDGGRYYLDAWDHKPPLMAWIYMLGGAFGWHTGLSIVKFLSILSGLTTLFLLNKILLKEKIATIIRLISLATAALLFGLPILETNVANAEVFFISLNTALLYLVLYKKHPWLGGFLLTLTFFLKPQSFIEASAVVLLACCYDFFTTKPKINFNYYLKIFLGFLLPVAVYLIYLLALGTFADFVDAVFLSNFRYVEKSNSYELANVVKLFIIAKVTGFSLIKLKTGSISRTAFIVGIVLALNLSLVTLSGRNYAHYWIQIVPVLTLACAICFARVDARLEIKLVAALLVVLLCFTPFVRTNFQLPFFGRGSLRNPVRYYSSFYNQLVNKSTDRIWRGQEHFLGERELVNYFNENYAGLDYYYYGENPWVFLQLEGNKQNKYLVWYHLRFTEAKMQEALTHRSKADVLIVDEKIKKTPAFFENLEEGFVLLDELEYFSIYAKNDD